MFRVVSKTLLADAEMGEDFAEDVVGGDFASNFAQPNNGNIIING